MSNPPSPQESQLSLESQFTLKISEGLFHFADNAEEDYELWLKRHFPHIATQPLAPRHKRLWRWFLLLGDPPQSPLPLRERPVRHEPGEGPSNQPIKNQPISPSPNSPPSPPSQATPRPRVEVWPRGGAKSATAELACAY